MRSYFRNPAANGITFTDKDRLITNGPDPPEPHFRLLKMTSPDRPLHLSLYSNAAATRPPRTVRGTGDVLIDNTPFNREYHLAVLAPDQRVVYDLPARCEPRGAVAVPVDSRGRVALVRQWRAVPAATGAESAFPLDVTRVGRRGFWSVEVPRGFPEEGEAGADAVRRETQEETGFAVLAVVPLGWANFNTAIMLSDQPVFLVRVDENVRMEGGFEEEGEKISGLQWYTVEELKRLVRSGKLRCNITLGALSHVFAADGDVETLAACSTLCEARLTDGLRSVAEAVERGICLLWEAGLDARAGGDFSVVCFRYAAAGKELLGEEVEGQKVCAGGAVVDRVEVHMAAGGARERRHEIVLVAKDATRPVVESYPTLKWKVEENGRVSLRIETLVVEIELGEKTSQRC